MCNEYEFAHPCGKISGVIILCDVSVEENDQNVCTDMEIVPCQETKAPYDELWICCKCKGNVIGGICDRRTGSLDNDYGVGTCLHVCCDNCLERKSSQRYG